jgi:exonuclease SbcD
VFVISGNHDSPERIAFGGRMMIHSGIHLSPVYSGTVERVVMQDPWGEVAVYLLPFLKPAHVRRYFPEREIESYTDAMAAVVESMEVDTAKRNLLVTHQFVTGALRSDSEYISVGGADNVDVSVFDDFDYVALGHIHGPQKMGRETVRYCGTPLKYSFSEASHKKSVTVVELREKGDVELRTVPLHPRRDLREIRGSYMELMDRRNYAGTATEDYLQVTLTDTEELLDPMGTLRSVYPNVLQIIIDKNVSFAETEYESRLTGRQKSTAELFSDFYEMLKGEPLDEIRRGYVEDAAREAECE